MSDTKKSPDNNDVSPIRGLFKQNEEAYSKHQQKVVEEKQRLAKERQEQQKNEEPEQSETVNRSVRTSENSEPSFGGRMKAFWGKIVEIVTQPEDGAFFGEDDDGFEDIYSEEQSEITENTGDGIYAEPVEEETSYGGESLIYRNTVSDSVSGGEYESDTEGVTEVTSEIETETISGQEEVQEQGESLFAEADVEEPESGIRLPIRQKAKKTEITLDAIMYAKNAGAEGTPITYTVAEGTDYTPADGQITVVEEQAAALEEQASETEGRVTAPEEQVTVPGEDGEITDEAAGEAVEDEAEKQENEPSHSEPEAIDEQEDTDKVRINELSHNTVSEENTVAEQKRVNELSHDARAEVKTENIHKMKNELSHDELKDNSANAEDATAKKASPNNNGKAYRSAGFSAGSTEPIVYHRSDSSSFIVMVGKFTKTLRSQYEDTRRLRGYVSSVNKGETESNENIAQKSVRMGEKSSVKRKQPKEPPKNDDNSKILKLPESKKRKRFHIKDLFSTDGDAFDEEEDIYEEKPEITDYQDKEDVAAIKNDINYNFRKRFFRTGLLTVLAAGSLILSLLVQLFPSLFMETIHNGWLLFGIINFILLAIAVLSEKTTIVYGLVPLKDFKATSDTAVSVSAVAAVIQSVTGLFLPNVYVNGTYHMYSFLIILAMLFNSLGKLIIIKRTADNFRFLCSSRAKYAGKIYTDKDNAPKLVAGLPTQRPIIAYTKKSRLMSNFLQLSYASDPIEDNATFFAPFTTVLSLICGLAYGFLSKDFVGGVSSFALTSFITTPICALIALNIPIKKLCNSTLRKGSMVVGYEAIKQFSDTNAIMIESNQLYPKGNIILSGIKAFNETKLNTAILAGAAVSFAVDGPMSHIFETIIQDRKHMIPDVESVSYDDNLGLSGWIGGQRILIGNRELMKKHNINMPDESIEAKYHKMGNEISYISMSGELVAMFILTYKVDKDIADSLRDLSQDRVNIIVRTIDPNISQKHIAEKFGIYQRCIKVLNTGLGNVCHEEINSVDKTSRAYVVTDGKLSAFAVAVLGCIRIKSTVTITKITQIISIVLGFLLVNLISFVSGFAKLGGLEILLYTGLWCVGLIIVSVVARKFN